MRALVIYQEVNLQDVSPGDFRIRFFFTVTGGRTEGYADQIALPLTATVGAIEDAVIAKTIEIAASESLTLTAHDILIQDLKRG